jgi:hypothetical protein
MEAFRFRGAELPADLEQAQQKSFLNPTGRIPSDEELDAAWSAKKVKMEKTNARRRNGGFKA